MSQKKLLLVSIETNVFDILKLSVRTLPGGMWAFASLGDTCLELAGGIEFLNFRFLNSCKLKFIFGIMVFRTRVKTPQCPI